MSERTGKVMCLHYSYRCNVDTGDTARLVKHQVGHESKSSFDGNDLTKVVGLLKGDALEVCLLLSRFYCSMYRKSMNEKLQML